MADLNTQERMRKVTPALDRNLDHLDEDLEIMERHAGAMAQVEDDIQESMRKWDREHKDDSLHSTPKPRKHQR